ncbi:MAG TPA: EipA family protein, partial [Alphaproteobacteria bacterium]|nr:EipA family protein [Alphaproteobacteria bacterium]
MVFASRLAAVMLAAAVCWTVPAYSQQVGQPYPPPAQPYQQPAQPYPQQQPYVPPPQQPYVIQGDTAPPPGPSPRSEAGPNTYAPEELVGAGHRFFGNVSRGLASVIERAVSQWGLPNGYVLGEEGSGA